MITPVPDTWELWRKYAKNLEKERDELKARVEELEQDFIQAMACAQAFKNGGLDAVTANEVMTTNLIHKFIRIKNEH